MAQQVAVAKRRRKNRKAGKQNACFLICQQEIIRRHVIIKIMKGYIFYRPNTEHERKALDYIRDFAMQTGKTLPAINPDTRHGAEMAALYGIMEYPAILTINDQGILQNLWIGSQLPSFSELSYYIPQESASFNGVL